MAHLLLTLVLLVAFALAAAVVVVPRVTGSVPLTVLTGSMRPHLEPGDMVIVRPTDPAALAVGDVVTFQPRSGDPTLVTHRIVEIHHDAAGAPESFVTQGDANGAPDAPLIPAQIQGRVWYSVPMIGRVTSLVHPLWIAVAGGVALIGYAVVTFLRPEDDGEGKAAEAADVGGAGVGGAGVGGDDARGTDARGAGVVVGNDEGGTGGGGNGAYGTGTRGAGGAVVGALDDFSQNFDGKEPL